MVPLAKETTKVLTDNNKAPESNGNLKVSNAVRLYFSINTGVIAAVMNVYNMAMKKHLKFLKTLAAIGGVVDIPGDNNDNQNAAQTTDTDQGGK